MSYFIDRTLDFYQKLLRGFITNYLIFLLKNTNRCPKSGDIIKDKNSYSGQKMIKKWKTQITQYDSRFRSDC